MSMYYRRIPVGPLEANTILLGREHTVLVDPGGGPDVIMETLREAGVTPETIVVTHAHFDHIAAVPRIAELTGAGVYVHSLDAVAMEDPFLNLSAMFGRPLGSISVSGALAEGDRIPCGTGALRVMHTPGHTPGSICLLWQADGQTLLVSGDTLFEEGYGRTDFPGGNSNDLRASLDRLDREIPSGTLVIPGHGRIFTKG